MMPLEAMEDTQNPEFWLWQFLNLSYVTRVLTTDFCRIYAINKVVKDE